MDFAEFEETYWEDIFKAFFERLNISNWEELDYEAQEAIILARNDIYDQVVYDLASEKGITD